MAPATGAPGRALPRSPTSYTVTAPYSPRTGAVAAPSAPHVTASTVPPRLRASVSSSSVVLMGAPPADSASTQTLSIDIRVLLASWKTAGAPSRRGAGNSDQLELLEEGDDALGAVALVGDDLARLALLGGGHVDDLLAGTGEAHLAGIEPEIGHRQLVDGLGLGRHDPLEGGVAGLDDTGGDRHDGGQRGLHLVVAGLGLALDVHRAVGDRHLLGEGDRRHAEQLGHLHRRGAGVPVGGLGGGQHQVGVGPLDRLGQDLGRRQGVGPLERLVAHQDGAGRSHGQGRAQARRLAVGRHRHQRHLAAAGLLGQLQPHLHPVGVGVVEDELALAHERLRVGIERLGGGGIGDLLDTDDDVHGARFFPNQGVGDQSAGRGAGPAPAGRAPSAPSTSSALRTSSVMTPSAPAAATRRRSSGSSTVQATTARPRARAAATSSPVTWGWGTSTAQQPSSTACARLEPASRAGWTSNAVPSPTCARRACLATASRVPGQNDDTTTRSGPAGAGGVRASTSTTAAAAGSSAPGCAGSFFTSIRTTRPAQAARAASSTGTPGGSSSRRRPASAPTPASVGSWATARAPSAVRRTSSSTPSAPARAAPANASRLFSGQGPLPPRWASTSIVPILAHPGSASGAGGNACSGERLGVHSRGTASMPTANACGQSCE